MAEICWLGGSSGAGKSSICQALASQNDIEIYEADPHVIMKHLTSGLLDENPVLARLRETVATGASGRWFADMPSETLADVYLDWSRRLTHLI